MHEYEIFIYWSRDMSSWQKCLSCPAALRTVIHQMLP